VFSLITLKRNILKYRTKKRTILTHDVSETQIIFFSFYNRTLYIYIYPASVMWSKTNKRLVFRVVSSVLITSSMFMLISEFTSLLCFLFRGTLQFQYPYFFTPCDQYLMLSSSTSTLKLYLESLQLSSLMITNKDLLCSRGNIRAYREMNEKCNFGSSRSSSSSVPTVSPVIMTNINGCALQDDVSLFLLSCNRQNSGPIHFNSHLNKAKI
jgi:hypothetical protein